MEEQWQNFQAVPQPVDMYVELNRPLRPESMVEQVEREMYAKYNIDNVREFFRKYNKFAEERGPIETVAGILLLPPGCADKNVIAAKAQACFGVINHFSRNAGKLQNRIVELSTKIEAATGKTLPEVERVQLEADRVQLGHFTAEYMSISRNRWKAQADLCELSCCQPIDAKVFHKDVQRLQRMWGAGKFKDMGFSDLSTAML